MKPRLYIVRWSDAHFVTDEEEHTDVMKSHKPAIYWSAGVLVSSDAVGVTLAQDFGLPVVEGRDSTFRSRTFIPRALVEEEFDAGPLIRRARKPRPAVQEVAP